jgi:tRNA(fMet)-specific endonuclease VapC
LPETSQRAAKTLMNPSGSVLVDTSSVVDYFRQDVSLHQKIDRAEDVYLPLVALGELFYGAYKSTQPDKALAQLQKFSRGCIILLPDEATAAVYGQIKAELRSIGKTIPENDVWIAAMAKQQDFPLAARDRHFPFVSGLTLLDW